ncbi:CRAL-TRIO domain-containing protein [Xylariaceae sp. FL0016]|nr:CRAL-TRIO domain-containing protein [Xylariaceae sp. FL0016]
MAEAKQTGSMKLDPKYDQQDFPVVTPETRSGLPGHLDESQQAQVDQLRMMLEGEGYKERLDTLTLLRFLRARKFDVNAAKKMFIESEQWRKAVTITDNDKKPAVTRLLTLNDDTSVPPSEPVSLDEQVRTWDKDGSFKKELSQYYKQFYHKTDKDGRPCYFEQLGGVDFEALRAKKFTNDKMLLNLAVEYEKMVDPKLPACSRKAGHLLETSCTVMDAAGVSILKPGPIYSYIMSASAMSNNNYPERLGKMYVLNVTWFLKTLWSVIKGFLDPVTASKIHILGSDYKKTLLEQIPAENLPKKYGGKCECPGGCELSDAGPWKEAEWYKPAWWEKSADDATIENKPTELGQGGAAAGAPADATVTETAAAPAPATS